MKSTVVDDGFAAYLVEGAYFDGKWEIPIIKKENITLPKDIVPYDKIKKISKNNRNDTFIHFYMHDITFRQIIRFTDRYINMFKEFGGIISPDCSLYIDMPLCLQLANTYLNRAVGIYMQNNGVNVIPNIRWGDERSFDFAFKGVEEEGIYCISTHGCIKSNEEKNRFKEGLREMIIRLKPKKVLVHGSMPTLVFDEFKKDTEFINYKSWISRIKKGVIYGDK